MNPDILGFMNASRMRRSWTASLVLLTLAGGQWVSAGASSRSGFEADAPAARFIAATISVDGVVVLQATTSDDGHPDADAVWNYLLGGLEFRPTKDFARAKIDPKARSVTLGWLKGSKTKNLGEPPKLELSVKHGGRDHPVRLILNRSGENGWRVDRKTVEGRFSYRWITREQASSLTKPRRKT